jgi:uncharacterized protein (TIGR03084 family)
VDAITADLAAEHEALDAVLRHRPDADWDVPTPAPGWSVRDQISHLWYFDGTAVLAATDPDAFTESAKVLMASGGPDRSVEPGRAMTPAELLGAWRDGRAELLEVLGGLDPSARIPWYGPAMGARSFATARLMETWAHGQDVVDALGASRPATDRLRHVAHIGVRARPFAYVTHGMTMPEADVFVSLDPPSGGDPWTWGDQSRPDRVSGPALDFCLVVTQRRHPADTTLVAQGPNAVEWMGIAQAFAGPPGEGRTAGQFA